MNNNQEEPMDAVSAGDPPSIIAGSGNMPTEAAPIQTANDLRKRDHSPSPSDASQTTQDPPDQGGPFLPYPKIFRTTTQPPPQGIPLSNSFSLLTTNDNQAKTQSSNPSTSTTQTTTTDNSTASQNKTPTPTGTRPKIGQFKIDLDSILCPNDLTKDLLHYANGQATTKCSRTELIITPKTVTAHNRIRDRLDNIRTSDLKQLFFRHVAYHFNRATDETREKLVIKGLPPKFSIDTIQDTVTAHQLTTFHTAEMQKRDADGNMTPLGIYTIEIPRRDVTKTKQTIKYIGHYSVRLEDYQQTDRVPQCKNCQKLYHTKTYCRRPTTCAHCSGNHDSDKCTNAQTDNFTPTCCNCKLNHPAFDPICQYITNARTLRNAQLQKSTPTTAPTPNVQSTTSFPHLRPQTHSYSSVISNAPSNTQAPNTQPTPATSSFQDLSELLTLIKSCDLKKLLSSITPIITIFKGPGDILSKLIQAAIKLVEIFN